MQNGVDGIMEKQLMVGFRKEKITPPFGCRIPGYFYTRISDGIITDLYMHATVFDDGENRAVFFSVDSIGILYDAYLEIRKMLAEKFGFDESAVFIHSTHSHTAFRILAPEKGVDNVEQVHRRWIYQKFCDCLQMALKDMKPAKVKVASGEAKGVGFIRRYRMKDGSCKTNPGYGNPDIVDFDGKQDNSVQLVRILREGGKEILFVNFATHADVIGGTEYCADWPGYTRDVLIGALGDNVEVMMLTGTEGDSNHCNRFLPKEAVITGPPMAKKMARILGGSVLQIYDSAKDVEADSISFSNKIVTVGVNTNGFDRLPLAREISDLYTKLGTNKDPIFQQYTMSVPAARRICRLIDNDIKSFSLQVSALRVGEIAFLGFPGEAFCEIGMEVKKRSEYTMTLCSCITNGGQGYFPTAAAFAEAGYERDTTPFAENVAELLIENAVALLEEIK